MMTITMMMMMMMERQWSSYRERPSGQHAEITPLSSLEAITDTLLEIMEVGDGVDDVDDDDSYIICKMSKLQHHCLE